MPEVGMLERLLRCRPPRGVPRQQRRDKGHRPGGGLGTQNLEATIQCGPIKKLYVLWESRFVLGLIQINMARFS